MAHDDHSENRPKVPKKTSGANKTTAEEAPVTTQCSSASTRMISVAAIVTHPAFEHLLRVDETLRARLARSIRKKGFLQPVILGIWPGVGHPVLIDGHVRRLAALDAGLEEIPCVIIEFPDQMSALELCIDFQTARRSTSDGVIFSLTEKFDTLMQRGGDRRSGVAKSKIANAIVEKEPTSSAKDTATLIGCHYTKVDRTRTIRKYGSLEIQEAVRKDQMTIHKAWKMIRDMQLGKDENTHNAAAYTKAAKRLLSEKNFEKLNERPGGMYEKMNAAVDYYIRSFGDTDREADD